MIDDSTISNLVYRIAINVNPDKIYLFGSYVTGIEHEDSDIDLQINK